MHKSLGREGIRRFIHEHKDYKMEAHQTDEKRHFRFQVQNILNTNTVSQLVDQ